MTRFALGSVRRMRLAVVSGVLLCIALGTGTAAADEAVERFLPEETLLYGGVDNLGQAFDLATEIVDRMGVLRDRKAAGMMVWEVSRELHIGQHLSRDQFIEATGLDPNGSAGLAWVLADPSYLPDRYPNENYLAIFPIRDRTRAQQVLMGVFVPEARRMTPMICNGTLQRIQRAKNRWKDMNRGAQPAQLTWEDLAAANPGLKPLRCPGGGDYIIGGRADQPRCTIHGTGRGGAGPTGELARRRMGDVTLVGGREAGTGYAYTQTHVVFSNNVNVLEAAVEAATGTHPRARLETMPGTGAGVRVRAYFQSAHLMLVARQEIEREIRRRKNPAVLKKVEALLRAPGPVTAELWMTDSATLSLSARIERNAGTERLLAIQPKALGALAIVPKDALLAVGTNFGRVAFSVIGDFALLFGEPEAAALFKLPVAATDGDGVFAMTRGSFEGEVPNMLFILRVADREAMEDVAAVWMGFMGHEMRAEHARTTRVGDTTIFSAVRGRRGQSFHYAFVGPFIAAGTKLDDVKAVILAHQEGQDAGLRGADRFRRLELPQGPANVIAFVDMPGLVKQVFEGEHERRTYWQSRRCVDNMRRIEAVIQKYKKEVGRLPATFEELTQFPNDPKRRRPVRAWCMTHGKEMKLRLDPATGEVSCRIHGTVKNPRKQTPAPRKPREEEKIFSAFGTAAVRLWLEDDGLLRGVLRLVPAM